MAKLDVNIAKMLETTTAISVSKTINGFMARCSIHGKFGNIAPVGFGTTPTDAMTALVDEAKNVRRISDRVPEKYKNLRPGQVMAPKKEKNILEDDFAELEADLKTLNLDKEFSSLSRYK